MRSSYYRILYSYNNKILKSECGLIMKIIITTEDKQQIVPGKTKQILLSEQRIEEEHFDVHQAKLEKHWNMKYLGKNKNNQLKIEVDNYWSIPFVFNKRHQIAEVIIHDRDTKCN